MNKPVATALMTKKIDKVKIAGINAANDLETAGGTLAGILMTSITFCDLAKEIVELYESRS